MSVLTFFVKIKNYSLFCYLCKEQQRHRKVQLMVQFIQYTDNTNTSHCLQTPPSFFFNYITRKVGTQPSMQNNVTEVINFFLMYDERLGRLGTIEATHNYRVWYWVNWADLQRCRLAKMNQSGSYTNLRILKTNSGCGTQFCISKHINY